VGAFDYAIGRIAASKGFKVNTIFACDMDKFARRTYVHNHGEPTYFPENVYNRDIPNESLDVYMTSPPCQSFSMAGARLGKDDKRGILFFNSLEFINKNQPRFFIFENVRGLMSDDGGKTFSEWINLLGGKSVNGLPVIFPYENAVNYHVYFDVLNAKEHGIPQNRERVFIIGIRDDIDNDFRFPRTEHLNTRLVDILESNVDSKFFLSTKQIAPLIKSTENDLAFDPGIKIKSNNGNGYEIATIGDAICFENMNSKTRRGRVGNQVAQTLDTQSKQGVYIGDIRRFTPRECFRLMDFPESFDFSIVSDTQAYKQAGNSIVVRVLEKIIDKLPL